MRKTIFSYVWMAATVWTLSNCNSSQKQSSDEAATDSLTTLISPQPEATDYYGTYSGTLPCADCEGIQTTLTLGNDASYSLKSEYLGKKGEVFEEKGTYHVLENQVIELTNSSSKEKSYYKLLTDALAVSDSLGNTNKGELAEQYKLKKQDR